MKKKIFASMCVLAVITILLTSFLISAVIYVEFYERTKLEVRNEAQYIAAALNEGGSGFLSAVRNASNRITLIEKDGTVSFDSKKDASQMENHLDRPEVAAALDSGHGEATRKSETVGEHTFYYALRLENGSIVRIASEVGSAFTAVRAALPYMFLIAVATFLIAMSLARKQTERIIVPINAIDLENPIYNDIYDELAPLLTRINKQNLMIDSHLGEIRHRKEELSAITENLQEGLVILDEKSAVLYINRSAIRIFDVKHNDYVHKNILALNRSPALIKAAERAEAGEPSEEILSVGEREYRIAGNAVRVDGRIMGVSLLITDETEKLEAERMRREFSANVSHELKTPLTAISGYAEIMKNGLAKPEDMSRFAERIYTEAARMITLIEDIILLSRLDEGGAGLNREDADLLGLSREICGVLRPQAEKRNISLSVTGNPTVIRGTRQILWEMIYNLCDNAIKYNREGGRVDVSIAGGDKETVLTVSDTGIGIPWEHQKRVFERFYRVDKSHSKETGGTGLGLSIVKHGAQYHHADLSLESEPDKGTTIRIIFPVLRAEG